MSGITGFGGLFWIAAACENGRMGDSGVFAGDSRPAVVEERWGDGLAMRVELECFFGVVWFEMEWRRHLPRRMCPS